MSIALDQVLRRRLAGFRDNASLLSLIGGGMMGNPLLSGLPSSALLGTGITAAGAYLLTNRLKEVHRSGVFHSEVDIASYEDNKIYDLQKDWGGMLLGYTTDTGKPLVIPWHDWLGHCFIIGQSGMGKTVLGEWLMFQQILRGGGLIWIDGKIDADNVAKLNAMCAYAGRRDDLRVVNPDDPDLSNSYNPILYGDADEVSARILSLIPSAENNPGADHYRQSANQGVTTTVRTIRETGFGYTFLDLSILLQSSRAMEHLSKIVPPGSDAKSMYSLFLERYSSVDKQGHKTLDMKKVSDLFGGVGGRLFSFGEGNFGRITNTYSPDVDLHEDIVKNRIVYIALPTMGKAEAASQFGKMAVGDYRSAIAKIQSGLSKKERPWPPTLGFFDEAGSYVTQSWARIFEQSRSAQQVLVPAVQTVANLDAVSPELREMVVGNTVTKIVFRLGTNESADFVSEYIGEEMTSALGVSAGGGAGDKANAGTGASESVQRSQNMGYSERYESVMRVPPEDLKSLGRGEAVVTTDGGKVYQIKIPRISFTSKFMDQVGPYEVNRLNHQYTKGLNLFDKFGKTAG